MSITLSCEELTKTFLIELEICQTRLLEELFDSLNLDNTPTSRPKSSDSWKVFSTITNSTLDKMKNKKNETKNKILEKRKEKKGENYEWYKLNLIIIIICIFVSILFTFVYLSTFLFLCLVTGGVIFINFVPLINKVNSEINKTQKDIDELTNTIDLQSKFITEFEDVKEKLFELIEFENEKNRLNNQVDQLQSCTNEQVRDLILWNCKLNSKQYNQLFLEKNITGKHLCTLKLGFWIDLGLQNIDACKLMYEIDLRKAQYDTAKWKKEECCICSASSAAEFENLIREYDLDEILDIPRLLKDGWFAPLLLYNKSFLALGVENIDHAVVLAEALKVWKMHHKSHLNNIKNNNDE